MYKNHFEKQFAHSFNNIVFDWYTNLELNSINNWRHVYKLGPSIYFKGVQAKAFNKLANRAHNIELVMIANEFEALSIQGGVLNLFFC